MAFICTKQGNCSTCPHFRYDDDYGANACFAEVDARNENNSTNSKFPKGTRIYVESIADDSFPFAVGKVVTVDYVDTASQIHCFTDDKRNVVLCERYGDIFRRI